jgi:hypothetical protein
MTDLATPDLLLAFVTLVQRDKYMLMPFFAAYSVDI